MEASKVVADINILSIVLAKNNTQAFERVKIDKLVVFLRNSR
jgi:hypothetical protein